MASGLLLMLDDVTAYLNKVSAMTKIAAKKASAVAGDDLALNSQQMVGLPSEQELTIIKKIAIGGFKNKALLIVVALILSAVLPFLIEPLLMLGGSYLCFEGVEKLMHSKKEQKLEDISVEDKIKGAIRTDFILSAEIIIISLGTMGGADLMTQITSLIVIGLGMNVLIYGLVACIVKIDDLGVLLVDCDNLIAKQLGKFLLWVAPLIMRILGVLGTLAMFLVGGGILAHNQYGEQFNLWLSQYVPSMVSANLVSLTVGVIAGLCLVGLHSALMRIKRDYSV